LSQAGPRRPAGGGALPHTGPSPIVYALIGATGVALVTIIALVVVLTHPGPAPAGGGGGEPRTVAEAPALRPVEPVAVPVAAPAAAAAAAPLVEPTSLASVPSPSSATSAVDSMEIVRRLKEATVYIKNKIGSKTLSSGTGFVIEAYGDTVIVATNRHVAVLDLSEAPARFVPQGSKPELEAVFRSGQGLQNEEAVPAQILAVDQSGDHSNDLAVLLVKGVKRAPQPINVLAKVEPTEGMTYNAAGFPFGGMLAKVSQDSGKGNPSVSITGGRISALRRDDHGQLLLLQVDGSLQPGNSGGPVLDDKTGKLLGVVVAKLGSVDTIGLIVPADELRKVLAGRVGAVFGTRFQGKQGTADLEVKAEIVDPKGQVQGVSVRIAPAASAGKIDPNGDGTWPPLPNAKDVQLQKDPKLALATGRVQVALSGDGAAARKVLIQAAHKDRKGTLVYAKPREYELPEKGSFGHRGRLARMIKAAQHRSVSMLGPLMDPDKDCTLTKDEENLKIKIEIPGKLHTLSPEITTRKNRRVALHNAPITLTDVEGDFAAVVEVTGEISPGSATPKDRQGHIIPFTVQSAGLILYQDKDNFLRLERAGSVVTDSLTPVHRLIIEAVKEGKQAMHPIYLDVPEKNTLLILVKRKGRVQCLFSPNGGQTVVGFHEFALDLPGKLRVGLTAANVSAKPFTATFENFSVINDATMLDEEFGEMDKPKDK
jgi:S1-C subfamily serine protease